MLCIRVCGLLIWKNRTLMISSGRSIFPIHLILQFSYPLFLSFHDEDRDLTTRSDQFTYEVKLVKPRNGEKELDPTHARE